MTVMWERFRDTKPSPEKRLDHMEAGIEEALAASIGGSVSVAWDDITGKPTIPAAATVDNLGGAGAAGKAVMKAADAAAARTAIGAGTSNLKVGTTASDAKAGNYKPTLAEIGAASQVDFAALVARVEALEAAAEGA